MGIFLTFFVWSPFFILNRYVFSLYKKFVLVLNSLTRVEKQMLAFIAMFIIFKKSSQTCSWRLIMRMTSCAALSIGIVPFLKLSPFLPNQKFLGQLRYPMKLLSEAGKPESRYILGFLSFFILNLNIRIRLSIFGMFMFG